MSTALVQSCYVGLRSGDFSRTTSCLVHRIRCLPYAEYHVKLMIGVFRRITGAKLGSLGVFGAAQVELLDGRIKEGSYPLPNEGGGKRRILTWVIWALWLGWASKSESIVLGLPTPLPLHLLYATHTRYARRKPPKRKALPKN